MGDRMKPDGTPALSIRTFSCVPKSEVVPRRNRPSGRTLRVCNFSAGDLPEAELAGLLRFPEREKFQVDRLRIFAKFQRALRAGISSAEQSCQNPKKGFSFHAGSPHFQYFRKAQSPGCRYSSNMPSGFTCGSRSSQTSKSGGISWKPSNSGVNFTCLRTESMLKIPCQPWRGSALCGVLRTSIWRIRVTRLPTMPLRLHSSIPGCVAQAMSSSGVYGRSPPKISGEQLMAKIVIMVFLPRGVRLL